MPLRRLAAAVATAAMVQAVQTASFLGGGTRLSAGFLAFHFLVVFGALLAIAMAAGTRTQMRVWAGACAVLPMLLAVWPESMATGSIGLGWTLTMTTACLAVVALYASLPLGQGLPLITAPAGAIAGAALMGWRSGSLSPATALVSLAAATAMGIAALRLRTRGESFALPAPLRSTALAAASLLVSTTPAFLPAENGRVDVAGELRSVAGSPPVVVIVLDAVRADHLALYGYERDTMPKLESLMRREGNWARYAVSNSPISLPSHASTFTGVYPPRHGAHKPFLDDPNPPPYDLYPLGPELPTAASLLSEAGYWTAAVSGNFTHLDPAMGLARGFDYYDARPSLMSEVKRSTPWCMAAVAIGQMLGLDGPGPCYLYEPDLPYRPATEITDEAVALIDSAGDRPFFLFVNYFDGHNPFRPPRQFADRFPGRISGQRAYELDGLFVAGGHAELAAADRTHLAAAYDGELAYMDSELGRLFDRLRRHPAWNDMMVVVMADHGMSFGDHRLVSHDSEVFEEALHIPFLVKPGRGTPGAPAPGTPIEALIQPVDVFPMLLQHAALEVPAGIDGKAWGIGRREALGWLYKDARLAAADAEFDRELRAIVQDHFKLIESTSGERFLFDLSADASESVDLSGADPARVAALQEILGPRVGWQPGTGNVQEMDAAVLQRLRSLGYIQ